jgi:hemolysin activation/secretion protein
MKSLPAIATLLAVLAIHGLSSSAYAQAPLVTGAGALVDKAKAQAPERTSDTTVNAPTQAPAPAPPGDDGDPTPLGVDLAALHLIARPTKSMPKDMSQVVLADPALHLPPHLADDLQSEFLGKPLSMAMLNRILKKITKAYQATDFPLVDAYLPEQDITSGQVQVLVREALLGAVRVEGAKHSDPDYMTGQVRVKPGDRIDTALIAKDVEWLNENPIRRVNVVYERGKQDGTSDVILKTEDSRPLQLYAGFANSGVIATGENEWSAGFNWFQAFGTQQSIAYNFSANESFDTINTHALVYDIPLPWRHRLQFISAYATTDIASGDPGSEVGVTGESRQLSAAYLIPLPSPWLNLHHKLTLASDYKSTDSDIFFGGQSFASSIAEVLQFRVGYDVSVTDSLGYTYLGLSGIYSPGDLVENNTDEAFGQLRLDAQADYWYGKVQLNRLVQLPKGFSLTLSATGQYSELRLLSTEQLLAGGFRTVRGFDESSARGDSGVLGTIELNLPALHFFTKEGKKRDNLTIFGFYDGAYLTSVGDYSDEPDQTLQSVGIGLRYSVTDYLDLRFAYGWNVGDSGILDAPEGHMHFGATVKF